MAQATLRFEVRRVSFRAALCWPLDGARLLLIRPVPGTLALLGVTIGPTGVFGPHVGGWLSPLVFVLLLGFLARLYLPGREPRSFAWGRLLALAALACIPLVAVSLPLTVLGSSGGGEAGFVLLLIVTARYGFDIVFWVRDMLPKILAVTMTLSIFFMPAAVEGYGLSLGRALRVGVSCWARNPLAAIHYFAVLVLLPFTIASLPLMVDRRFSAAPLVLVPYGWSFWPFVALTALGATASVVAAVEHGAAEPSPT